MSTVAETLVEELQRAGTPAIAGLPGGGISMEILSAAASQGLRFVQTSTETGSALLAAAQAEITGRPSACLTTLGPGVCSVVNGVAHAALDRVPLLVISEDVGPLTHMTVEHQVIDQESLLQSLVKASVLVEPEKARGQIRDVIALAASGQPGPVHIRCSQATIAQSTQDVEDKPSWEAEEPIPDGILINEAVDSLLARSKKPLLLIGLAARDKRSVSAIRALCSSRELPVLTTYKAKGVVPDDDPHFVGILTNGYLEHSVLAESDLHIGIGLDPVELLPRPWNYETPFIHVGRAAIKSGLLRVTGQLLGDAPSLVASMDASLTRRTSWSMSGVREAMRAARERLWSDWIGFNPADVVRECADALPFARVTVDSGAHMLAVMELWPANEANQLLISNGLSTMGFALPAAIGCAIASEQEPVVAFTGDGGLLICIGELNTLARENLKVICVVFNDRSLSLIRIKQELNGREPIAVSLEDSDFVKVAEAFGIPGARCGDRGQLRRALDEAIARSGPSLIQCDIDGSGYASVLRQLRGESSCIRTKNVAPY